MGEKIPKRKMPKIDDYTKMYIIDEKFVSLTDAGLLVDSQYVKYGSPTDCYARETVANLLKTADKVAKGVFGVRLLILDAYRPVSVQTTLWDKYYCELKAQYPDLAEEELIAKVKQFVSKPSEDIFHPSVHNTGGAVDVTLVIVTVHGLIWVLSSMISVKRRIRLILRKVGLRCIIGIIDVCYTLS